MLAHIEQCCILYNQLLCERIQAWKKNKESLSRYDQQETLPMLKKQYNPFSLVHSQVLQQVCQRVDWAFKGFFRRLKGKSKTGEKAGFPRYKNEHRYDSITYPQFANGCRLDDKGLRLG
ncbi:MAG: transposase, partial [Gemmatimonadota bacterium]|nr:transposase [Gemmatimonadota bacterium]